jgi:hypothetical protein
MSYKNHKQRGTRKLQTTSTNISSNPTTMTVTYMNRRL